MHRMKAVLLVLNWLAGPALCPPRRAPNRRAAHDFEDMMHMKRLGETAVSPDGKWLASASPRSISTRTPKRPSSGFRRSRVPTPSPVPRISSKSHNPATAAPNSPPTGTPCSSCPAATEASRFGSPTSTRQPAREPTRRNSPATATEADNAKLVPRREIDRLYRRRLPRLSSHHPRRHEGRRQCNADRDKAAAASKVKAQLFTHLLYRHWNHFTGDKRSPPLPRLGRKRPSSATSRPNDPHDVPPFSLRRRRRFLHLPRHQGTSLHRKPRPRPGHQHQRPDLHARPDQPRRQAGQDQHQRGGNFNPAYSPDGKYLAWRSQHRAGYESDKFRLLLYDRTAKTSKDLTAQVRQLGG